MEEFVGKIWHRWITNAAGNHYPDAEVRLDDVRHSTAIFFRALGGEPGLRIENAADTLHGAKRSFLQRIAGSGEKAQLAWRDEETLRLPDSISIFPQESLNRDLYLWLAALAAIDYQHQRGISWIETARNRTLRVMEKWPGLGSRYRRLVEAHLAQRPSFDKLSENDKVVERAIRQALLDPDKPLPQMVTGDHPPQPVLLWLHPAPPFSPNSDSKTPVEDADSPPESSKEKKEQSEKRYRAERTETPEGDDGLIAFRLESLFTWAEFIKVDRTTEDDDDEEDAERTADDMDVITVARDSKSAASRVRIDLDLPSDEYDDIRLGEGIPLPEWDFKKRLLIPDHCRLQPMLARNAEPMALPDSLRAQARKLRNQFEILRPQRQWFNHQQDGTELDLDSYITHLSDRKLGFVSSDLAAYRELRATSRDLSCLLLADLSLSTDTWVNNDARVIDIIRDSLYLFSEALSATGDKFALYGFSSRNRNHVRYHTIKEFSENYDNGVRGRINGIKPGYYTRMGAAIRHASSQLAAQGTAQKILLILTDGKPNDLDKYEGRYGIEDTREAVLEAEKLGLQPFCVTIDEKAQEYLPYLFGSRSYVLIRNAEELPRKLPLLYMRLTH